MTLTKLLVGWRIRPPLADALIGYTLLPFAYALSWLLAVIGAALGGPEVFGNAILIAVVPLTFVANTFIATGNPAAGPAGGRGVALGLGGGANCPGRLRQHQSRDGVTAGVVAPPSGRGHAGLGGADPGGLALPQGDQPMTRPSGAVRGSAGLGRAGFPGDHRGSRSARVVAPPSPSARRARGRYRCRLPAGCPALDVGARRPARMRRPWAHARRTRVVTVRRVRRAPPGRGAEPRQLG